MISDRPVLEEIATPDRPRTVIIGAVIMWAWSLGALVLSAMMGLRYAYVRDTEPQTSVGVYLVTITAMVLAALAIGIGTSAAWRGYRWGAFTVAGIALLATGFLAMVMLSGGFPLVPGIVVATATLVAVVLLTVEHSRFYYRSSLRYRTS